MRGKGLLYHDLFWFSQQHWEVLTFPGLSVVADPLASLVLPSGALFAAHPAFVCRCLVLCSSSLIFFAWFGDLASGWVGILPFGCVLACCLGPTHLPAWTSLRGLVFWHLGRWCTAFWLCTRLLSRADLPSCFGVRSGGLARSLCWVR